MAQHGLTGLIHLTPKDAYWVLAAVGVVLILQDVHLDTGVISIVGAACLIAAGYGLAGIEGAAVGAAVGVPLTVALVLGLRTVPKGPSRVPEVRDLISERGEVVREDPLIVRVRGEEWLAETVDGGDVSEGDEVEIVGVKGSTILLVRPLGRG